MTLVEGFFRICFYPTLLIDLMEFCAFFQIEKSAVSNGLKKRKLNEKTDYIIGFVKGKDIYGKAPPKELHIIALEAKTSIGEEDFWQCVAETATLFKSRVDAGKEKKSVWGILQKNIIWTFAVTMKPKFYSFTV